MPTFQFNDPQTNEPFSNTTINDFGMCAPGSQSLFSPAYWLTNTSAQTANCTINMYGDSACFVATLVDIIDGGPAKGTHLSSVSTSGASSTTNQFTIAPAVTPPAPGQQTHVQITFNAPVAPIPQVLSGTVQINWLPDPSGEPVILAEITVTANTAQLFMTGPKSSIYLIPGGSQSVPLTLEFAGLAGSSLSVNIGPSMLGNLPTLDGLEFNATVTILEDSQSVGGITPKIRHPHRTGGGGIGETGQPPGETGQPPGGTTAPPILIGGVNSLDFDLHVAASQTITPGNNQHTNIGFTAPSLPAAIGGPNACSVIFDIPPVPINLSINSQQPIDIIRGRTATINVSLDFDGAPTTLIFGQPTDQSLVTITSPMTLEIGGGSEGIVFVISVPVDDTTTNTDQMTIDIPWSAYDGLSKGVLKVALNILPGVIVFKTGSITTSSYDLTGSVTWTLYQNGAYSFIGSVTNSYITDETYSFVAISDVQDQNNANIVMSHSGSVSDTDSFNEQGSNQRIQDLWLKFLSSSTKFVLSVDTNIGLIIGVIVGTVVVFLLSFGTYEEVSGPGPKG
jgi:hypothetical protein